MILSFYLQIYITKASPQKKGKNIYSMSIIIIFLFFFLFLLKKQFREDKTQIKPLSSKNIVNISIIQFKLKKDYNYFRFLIY